MSSKSKTYSKTIFSKQINQEKGGLSRSSKSGMTHNAKKLNSEGFFSLLWSKLSDVIFFSFIACILLISVRGLPGVPTSDDIRQDEWMINGPFELSPERGRFALLYSIVEDNSVIFSDSLGLFTSPDVGYLNGNYVSLFAPGVSYMAIPGYMLGKYFGYSQVGAFLTSSFFAFLNSILLYLLAKRLGATSAAAKIASVVFLFATPAFAYAVTLYQHHISTFLILTSLYLLLRFKSLWSLILIWFLFAASIPIDYPNLFMMFPIALAAFAKLFLLEKEKEKVTVKFRFLGVFTAFSMIFPLFFFFWFNFQSYGNPLQFSGTVSTASYALAQEGKTPDQEQQLRQAQDQQEEEGTTNTRALKFFDTRKLLNGMYHHAISPDRGILWFTPVMLFSIFGGVIAYKKRIPLFNTILGVLGMTFLLYSMWGDPYGGWAFGSRYMIPVYALLALFISLVLTQWKKNLLFLLFFFLVLSYSIGVNTLGAITSNRNPPRVEILGLEQITKQEEKYTYERNYDYLLEKGSKSFSYNTYFSSYVSPIQFYILLTSCIAAVVGILIVRLRVAKG